MALFRSVPEVKIHAPATFYTGERYMVEIEVIAKDETEVDNLDVSVIAEEGWKLKSDMYVENTLKTFERYVRLMEKGVLRAGSTTFSAEFKCPVNLPPTHENSPAWTTCVLSVRVGVPWWPDPRHRFPLTVRRRVTERIERAPLIIRSTRIDAPADKPRIEIGLGSTRLVAGEVLAGTVALFHLDDSKPREIELALVPQLMLFGRGNPRERRGTMVQRTLELPAGHAGKSHDFEIAIPDTLVPGFKTYTHALAWHLVARTGSFFGGKVELVVPLEILDPSAAPDAPRLLPPPGVADARATTLLAQLAQTDGWTETRGEVPGQSGVQPAATRQVDGSEARIAYSYRDQVGTFLVSRVDHPALGLGLSVTPSSSLRHVFLKDVEVDIAEWDRAHRVAARFSEQAIPFLRAAIGPAFGAKALGQLVRWDDDAIVYERLVSSLETDDLAAAASAIGEVAIAIEKARPTIASPPGVTVDIATWQDLARKLRGTLTIGELAIDGELDRMPVSLGLTWDVENRPGHIVVEVGVPDRASGAMRETTIRLARPAQQYLDVSKPELAERLARWPEDIGELQILDGVATASLVGTFDATRVRDLVQELRALLAALDPEAGPYR